MSAEKLSRVAARHGGRVENAGSGRFCVYLCWAPRHHVWEDGMVHAISVEWVRGEKPHEYVEQAVRRMSFGVVACDADCDCYCSEDFYS